MITAREAKELWLKTILSTPVPEWIYENIREAAIAGDTYTSVSYDDITEEQKIKLSHQGYAVEKCRKEGEIYFKIHW